LTDYTFFYKERMPREGAWPDNQWDIFLSGFNSSSRVDEVFRKVVAREKHWLIQPEYGYRTEEYPSFGTVFAPGSRNEAEFIGAYLEQAGAEKLNGRLCIDSTGFMRHHLMFLMRWLKANGPIKFDVLYTDPIRYVNEEKTEFSRGPVLEVRQVAGYEGQHRPEGGPDDLLVIGAGYEHELIRRVAEHKGSARKVQMFGLPSLKPDMYQQCVLNAMLAAEAVGPGAERTGLFAPANDPFATAEVLHQFLEKERKRTSGSPNIYLSPVGTKAQTVGFALFYLTECVDTEVSIVFPFVEEYSPETSKGVSQTWRYTIEL
jgi:hypothetical protein